MSASSLRCLAVLLAGVGIAGCADVAGDHVGLSFLDGYAAPGETIRVAAYTRRSLGGSINSVRIEGASLRDAKIALDDSPGGAGSYLETDGSLSGILRTLFVGDKNHPMTVVSIPIPVDTTERGTTSIALRINYTQSVYDGPGRFRGASGEEVLSAPVTLVAPGSEWKVRLRDIAARCALALVFGGVCVFVISWLNSRSGSNTSLIVPLLSFVAVVAYIAASLWYVSEPLAAIFGWPVSGYRVLLWLGMVVAPLVIVEVVRTHVRKMPIAAAPNTTALAPDKRAA